MKLQILSWDFYKTFWLHYSKSFKLTMIYSGKRVKLQRYMEFWPYCKDWRFRRFYRIFSFFLKTMVHRNSLSRLCITNANWAMLVRSKQQSVNQPLLKNSGALLLDWYHYVPLMIQYPYFTLTAHLFLSKNPGKRWKTTIKSILC